ncbi:hypothetical protein LB100_05340 [Wolbachia endosymbiont of Protocalliphora sialia]
MNKNITFKALKEEHFSLLLKWVETPHVKLWWDADINWTQELIEKKYSNYVKGFKRLKFKTQIIEKPMHASLLIVMELILVIFNITTNMISHLNRSITL